MNKYCPKCGAQLEEGVLFCGSCGAKLEGDGQQDQAASAPQQNFQQNVMNLVNNTADETAEYDADDINKNKSIAGLAYLIFFLPLVSCPESRFGKFHANQGLSLLIVAFVGMIIFNIIPFLNFILVPAFSLCVLALIIIGLLNGLNGKAKELPIIGKFRLIK